jgi:dipeptidyl aminopeptidase/acylaminoacyl peptidase
MIATHAVRPRRTFSLVALLLLVPAAFVIAAPGTKTLTFQDLMRFRAIEKPVVSDDGTVVAYGLQPDRGDGEAVIHIPATGRVVRVPLGSSPVIAKNGRWAAMVVKPSFVASEKAGKDKPKPGMAFVDVTTGVIVTVDKVERFALSDDGKWLAYLLAPTETKPNGGGASDQAKPGPVDSAKKEDQLKVGSTLKLRDLAAGTEQEIGFVASFVFDPASKFLALTVSGEGGTGNGVFVRALADTAAGPFQLAQTDKARFQSLTWSREGSLLAFLAGGEKATAPATLSVWDGARRQTRQVVSSEQAPKGWTLPLVNEVTWSKDGQRLFFGFKPDERAAANAPADPNEKAEPDPYDVDQLLSKVEGDVWHWNDPRIVTQQKMMWEREKDRTWRAVVHMSTGKVVSLATLDVSEVTIPENPRVALGTGDRPYLKLLTWDGRYRDVYAVDLETGARTLVVRKLRDEVSLSPDGRWVVYFDGAQWQLFDVATRATRGLTAQLGVTWFDEENDTPEAPRSYGLGGWVDDGAAVLVYDRYDIWKVPTGAAPAVNLTAKQGRPREVTFRVVSLDPETTSLSSRDPLLLTAYHNREKSWGFYTLSFGKPGLEQRLDEKKLFTFLSKAKKADVLLYTREDYGEFPDVWMSDMTFRQPTKITSANPQLAEYAWGTAELVNYATPDGKALQGVLIKPANYVAGRRYPVITYFYERQSQRLYEFNEPVVNHRPSFPVYAGAGYAIFLPDIVFTVGHPGQSMVTCLEAGVRKLIDMGVADPKALGLHGHSWGGYGTAYVVTQTNMFAAAVTGAPVANMTSAYGGIRWESGMARLFQYEQSQSRIGGTLWDKRDLFIENSALFFVDRIRTPLLIEHGDDDGAVPWYQSIELYLAMRRLGKDCIFLQYRGEPHHLKKYANKLDYSIKMKQYFDHYLKGEPAPEWIRTGVAYRGK